jgi:hypothetical protein
VANVLEVAILPLHKSVEGFDSIQPPGKKQPFAVLFTGIVAST